MGWFKKKKGVVDFTRGAHKVDVPDIESGDVERGEVVDLSSDSSGSGFSSPSTPSSSSEGMGFLSDLAGASSTNSNLNNPSPGIVPSPGPITDRLRDARKSKLKEAFNEMKLRIDDSEFKMNDTVSKVRDMERRLRELERR